MSMTKRLLSTTALASAGLTLALSGDAGAIEPLKVPSAGRIKIEVHGYMQQLLVGLHQDFNDDEAGRTPQGYKAAPFDVKMNPEICFVGETALDNGITVGVNVQLEGQLPTSDYIDEQYLYLSSDSWGKVILGSENNAAYLLHVGSPDGGISVDSGDVINDSFYVNTAILDFFDSPAGTTFLRNNDNDSQKITYITPRVAGFQAGVSYIPKFQPGGGDGNSPDFEVGGAGNGSGHHNGWAGGLNYTQNFGQWTLATYGGAMWAEQTTALDSDGSDDDLFAYGLGAQAGFAGFKLGGAYHQVTSGKRTAGGPGVVDLGGGPDFVSTAAGAATSMKGGSYALGGSYDTGPYRVGVAWLQSSTEGAVGDPSDQKHRVLAVSGSWGLGPGVQMVGGFFWFNDDAEDTRFTGNVGTNPAQFVENTRSDTDGWGLVAGFKLSF